MSWSCTVHLVWGIVEASSPKSRGRHLAQNGLKNATVSVVINLNRGVDACFRLEGDGGSIARGGMHGDLLQRFDVGGKVDIEGLVPGQTQG